MQIPKGEKTEKNGCCIYISHKLQMFISISAEILPDGRDKNLSCVNSHIVRQRLIPPF